MTYLLDTNVLSEQRKSSPDAGVRAWFESVRSHELHVSVITVGEIRRGIRKLELRNDHRQAERYERWLAETRTMFADRLVPITTEAADLWGRRDATHPMPVPDGLIGATAAVHGWTLVTRNTKDFEHTGVQLLNPFAA